MASLRISRALVSTLVTAAFTALSATACSSQDPGAVTPSGPRTGEPGLPSGSSGSSGNGAASSGGGTGSGTGNAGGGTASNDTPDAAVAPADDASSDAGAPSTDASAAVDASNTPSGPAVISFTLLDTSVTNVVQGSPVTGQDPIKNGSTISLGTVGTALSIRANLNVTTIGSVGFAYDGNNHTENATPYVLCGDNGTGTVNNCNLAAGTHTITATPYSAASLGGTAGTPLTITFTLTP